jgi:hypothetical protein
MKFLFKWGVCVLHVRVPAGAVGAGRGMSGPWRAHEQVHEIPRRRVTAGGTGGCGRRWGHEWQGTPDAP